MRITSRKTSFLTGSLLLGLVAVSGAFDSLVTVAHGDDPQVLNSYSEQEKLERGEHLATISNCQGCHTVGDGDPYVGGVEFSTDHGVIYSSNITPDIETGIGSWSLQDFRNSLRRGVRPNGENLYPVFPYPHYTKFIDDDIEALYVYLKTIDPVAQESREHDLNFPYNINFLMKFWNWLYLEEGEYVNNTQESDEWNRGAYLVEGALHCSQCHSPRNLFGGVQQDMAYTGAVYHDRIRNGEIREWAATNLTQAREGLGEWSRQDLMDYLKTGNSARAVSFGPMNKVIMDGTRHLDETGIESVVTYITGLEPNRQEPATAASEETIRAGARLYTIHCGTCHLATGMGGREIGVPLVGSSVVQAPDPSTLINVILYGPEIPPPPFFTGREDMKIFGELLRNEEVAQIASFVRSSWGNAAGGVTADQVEKQR